MSERTAVYRLIGQGGSLLYVGISKGFGQRWIQHAHRQSWWPEVTSQTLEWFDTREDALRVHRTPSVPSARATTSRTAARSSFDALGRDFPKLRIRGSRSSPRTAPTMTAPATGCSATSTRR